ncbi:MAG: hypothetical protein JXP34_16430 [Planctomycetes bacterium]|nr:hypothetical protein [Planctomycetota bacterium]
MSGRFVRTCAGPGRCGWAGGEVVMLSEPRTVTFLSEIVHIPATHAPERLRAAFAELCRRSGYENFIRTSAGARIERPADEGGGPGRVVFSSDRIEVREDGAQISVLEYATRLQTVLEVAVAMLGIPLFVAQQTTLRTIATPLANPDAEQFIGRRLFRVQPEDLEALGRPVRLFGVRLVFPSRSVEEPSYNLRIETYARDPKSLYIENQGVFKVPIPPGDVRVAGERVQATAEFIADKVCPFLSRFDETES